MLTYRLGLDIGIGSCGFAVLQTDKNGIPFKIIKLDSIVFPKGETYQGKSVASARRTYRGQRRVERRCQFRKHRVKGLFVHHHLLTKSQINHVFDQKPLPSVFDLRTKALDKPLTDSELFQVMYYLAGHRGFKSNRKYARKAKDAGKLIKAIDLSKAKLHKKGYRTYGEMLNKDPKFSYQKHNHDYNGGYLSMPSRKMVDDEAEQILKSQQRFNHKLTDEFVKHYLSILDSQRNYDMGPSKPSPFAGNQVEKMIGRDTLDHTQERCAKATYTFEVYDLLCRLNNLSYKAPKHAWTKLNAEQRKAVVKLCFKYQRVTFKRIKATLKLDAKARFNTVNYSLYKSQTTAEKKSVFASLTAIHQINKLLPKKLQGDHNLIDNIGTILTKFVSDESRRKAFKNRLELPQVLIEKLLTLNFSEFGHYSIKTMRRMIPYLKRGMKLYDIITKLGYSHKKKIDARYIHKNLRNPVVMRAFTIVRKVVKAVINRYGKPDGINIELDRDLAKPYIDRKRIAKKQNGFQKINQRACDDLRDHGYPVNGQNITVSKLFHEQHGIDPYTGKKMDADKVFNGNGNYYNIDHIVPYSWTFNDKYTNKILVSAKANEEKENRLPLQYLSDKPKRQKFLIDFAKNTIKSYRKRQNLLKSFVSDKDLDKWRSAWKSRNIVDTSYINKLIANYLKQNIEFSDNQHLGKRRVVTLNGTMTAKMRHRWGLAKVRADGDKHHALDATVIASVTFALVKRINDLSKYHEIEHNPKLWKKNDMKKLGHEVLDSKLFTRFVNAFPLPWKDFRHEVIGRLSDCPSKAMKGYPWEHYTPAEISLLKPVNVVKVVSHKINKQVAGDTLRSGKYLDKGLVMSRFKVSDLKLKKGQVKKGYFAYRPKKDQTDGLMYSQLRKQLQIHGGKGSKAFPKGYMSYRDSNGHQHIVRKVKLYRANKGGITANHGRTLRDRKSIVRIDIFYNTKLKQYRYVPIYLNAVLDSKLPNRVASDKHPYLTDNDEFKMSLSAYNPVHILFKRPRKITWVAKDHENYDKVQDFYGYFDKPNVSNGQLDLKSFDNTYKMFSTGMSTIKHMDKLNISYLGDIHKVHQTKRMPFKV